MTRPIPFFAVLMLVGTSLGFGQAVTGDSRQESSSEFEGKEAGDRRELVPGIAFHWCPSGEFTMGTPGATNDETTVTANLRSGYWLGESEITQRQWYRVMITRPWLEHENAKQGVDYPVTFVTYDDAVEFCEKLTAKERQEGRLQPGWRYFLPNGIQWEYGCRAGTQAKYSFGDDSSKLGEFGWFGLNTLKTGENYAHQVGLKPANQWGLKDMHGIVSEWCSDSFEKYRLVDDLLQGPFIGSGEVSRGGGWRNPAPYCRSASRRSTSNDTRSDDIGFRIAAVRE